jgi:hypothetical protein
LDWSGGDVLGVYPGGVRFEYRPQRRLSWLTSIQACVITVTRSLHARFLLNPWQYSILPSWHPTLHSLDPDSIVKQPKRNNTSA